MHFSQDHTLTFPQGGKAQKDTLCCLSEPLQCDAPAQRPTAGSMNGTWAQLTLWYMYTQKVRTWLWQKAPDATGIITSVSLFLPLPSAEQERGEHNGAVVERNALRMVCRRKWDGVYISNSSVVYFTFSLFFFFLFEHQNAFTCKFFHY